MTTLRVGQWLPDLPDLDNPGATEAKNVRPKVSSYATMRGLTEVTDTMSPGTRDPVGGIWARASDNTIYNFAGDTGRLYRLLSNLAWSNVNKTPSSVLYNNVDWEFAQFGDRILAANIGDTVQYFDMGTSSNFDDLPNAPNAAHIAVVRDFVVVGNIDDGTAKPDRVAWSGFNNSEQWTPSRITQSDAQDLRNGGGPIKKVVGGDVGVIFQERVITRMQYVGPSLFFRFDTVETNRGTPASNSVVRNGTRVYFYSADGFYMLDVNGGEAAPLGDSRVNDWFLRNAAPSEISNMRAVIDRENSTVMWLFKTTTLTEHNDRVIMYNWQADRWAYAEIDAFCAHEYAAPGINLDGLDGVLTDIDSTSISVDSPVYQGGSTGVLFMNADRTGSTLTGAPLPYCVETPEFSPGTQQAFVNKVYPLIEGANAKQSVRPLLTVLGRDTLQESPTTLVQGRALSTGVGTPAYCVRVNKRFLRFRLEGPGASSTDATEHIIGVEFDPKTRGRR